MTSNFVENALIEKPKALLQPSFSLVFFSIFLKFTKYIFDYFQSKFLTAKPCSNCFHNRGTCQNFSQHLLFMTSNFAENALIEKPKALLQPSFSLVFFSIFLKFTKYIFDYFQNKFLTAKPCSNFFQNRGTCQNFSQHLLFMTSNFAENALIEKPKALLQPSFFSSIFQYIFKVYKVYISIFKVNFSQRSLARFFSQNGCVKTFHNICFYDFD